MLNDNEAEINLSHVVIANLLMQSTDCLSLTKNEDTLRMAVNLNQAEYKTLTLTLSQRLYCDLLRISEKSRYYLDNPQELSEKGKINLTKRCHELEKMYSEIFCELWENAKRNYDDIEKLSNCLYETNQILPNEQKIRPKFSDVTFSFSADEAPPGNFCYSDMENVKFIDICFSEWGDSALEGASFDSCHFSMNSLCSIDIFNKTSSFHNCTFKNIIDEMSHYITVYNGDVVINDYAGDIPTEMNNQLIEAEIKNYKKIKKRDDVINKLKQENRDLREQLGLQQTGTQVSSSASSFFDLHRRENHPISDNLSDVESPYKTLQKRGA